jgi:hypothetical protein
MKILVACLLACATVFPATAARQFPAPTFARAVPEAAGDAIAVSTAGNKVFVANAALDRVAVVDEEARVTYVPVGRTPRQVLSVGFGFITANAGDGSVSLSRDLVTATTIPAVGSGPLVADGQGRVFMLRPDGIVVVIDVAAFTARSFDTGLRAPVQHAVGNSGPLMVADASGEIRVFDVFSDRSAHVDTLRVSGRPGAMLWLELPRLLYVLVDDAPGKLVEVSVANRTVTPSGMAGDPRGVRAMKLVGNTLYAGFSNVLVMINLSSRYMDFVEAEVLSIDVDPAGRAFVLDAHRNLRVFEPGTLRTDVVALPGASTQVRYLRGTCNAYVAGAALSIVRAPCSDAAPEPNLQALWWVWNGSQSGWGLNLTHQGSTLFATWFTYDAQGQPTWLVMSSGRSVARYEYAGELYRTSGPPFNAATFDPARVTRTQEGTARVLVSGVDYVIFAPTVNGASMQFPLGRQVFSWPIPMCDTDVTPGPLPVYQGLWWNPAESGWGVNVAHQGNILFVTWFTYDTDGKATWFVGSDVQKTGNATYAGTLYKTFGPPMTASPWDPSRVTRMPVGSVTFTFRDDDNGTFAYTVNGISGSKAITRQVFASPVTRCR